MVLVELVIHVENKWIQIPTSHQTKNSIRLKDLNVKAKFQNI